MLQGLDTTIGTPRRVRVALVATAAAIVVVAALAVWLSLRYVAGERSRTAKVERVIYLFFILAFGLVGLAWVIKILFF